jgi:hypothetical protein
MTTSRMFMQHNVGLFDSYRPTSALQLLSFGRPILFGAGDAIDYVPVTFHTTPVCKPRQCKSYIESDDSRLASSCHWIMRTLVMCKNIFQVL